MTGNYTKSWLAGALLLFCAQVLAAPLLSCCSGIQAVARPLQASPMHDMPGHDAGHMGLGHSGDAHVHHGATDGAAMPAEPMPGTDCDHQCSYCLGLYSAVVMHRVHEALPATTIEALQVSLVQSPRYLPETLFRPPRFA